MADKIKQTNKQTNKNTSIYCLQNSHLRARDTQRLKVREDVEINFLPQNTSKIRIHVENSYRTPTERWQKTSDFPKGKKLPTYLGRSKEKRKNRDKRIGAGAAPLGGSCEGGKVSTH